MSSQVGIGAGLTWGAERIKAQIANRKNLTPRLIAEGAAAKSAAEAAELAKTDAEKQRQAVADVAGAVAGRQMYKGRDQTLIAKQTGPTNTLMDALQGRK